MTGQRNNPEGLGDPHGYCLSVIWQAYGRPSETERVPVASEGLASLRQLNIQSDPRGNSWEKP